MSGQQAYVTEAIAAMKRAIKRKAYDSDSDSDVNGSGNRGHKLQKRARYVRQGQISVPSGPAIYKEFVEHAGYHRAILSRNPVLVDEEGYPLESDDDEEHVQEVIASAAELDPYAGLRLERILAPLTAASDLPNHPALSRAYTSKTLTQLGTQGRDIMHKENQSLWKVKHLLTKLSGDHPWAPCGLMEGKNDIELFLNGIMALRFGVGAMGDQTGKPKPSSEPTQNGNSVRQPSVQTEAGAQSVGGQSQPTPTNKDIVMGDVDSTAGDKDEKAAHGPETNTIADSSDAKAQNGDQADSGESEDKPDETTAHQDDIPTDNDKTVGAMDVDGMERPLEKGTSVNGDVGAVAEETEDFVIHPLFLQPQSSRPDGNFGLPDSEAEDLRRFLQMYVQKQEEICRGVKKLYEGLLKADRLRKTVFEWSKAEGHCGPNRDMSDGEDWYDKEEWGLEDDLKKGHDDEEEEATSNQKKTRNRR